MLGTMIQFHNFFFIPNWKCQHRSRPQVVHSVKWQIKDSTTNFFTLILLREQQLSTVTISAQGLRDKHGAVHVEPELYLPTSLTLWDEKLCTFLTIFFPRWKL